MAANDLDLGSIELDLSKLEDISGGQMIDEQKSTLYSIVSKSKRDGCSLSYIQSLMPKYLELLQLMYPYVTLEEVQSYVASIYPSC